MPRVLQLQVLPARASLEPARLAVLGFLEPMGIRPRALYAVELVLEEVLSNIVAYGFPDRAALPIGLVVTVGDALVELRFEDAGIPFDPLHQPARRLPGSIDEAAPGGRGLLLLRRFAHSLHYERVGGHNVLTVGVAGLGTP